MNMLVQPAPLPEELDRGYLGRIMRINGYRHLKEMTDAMAAHFGYEGVKWQERTTHELLSRMAGMTTEQFAQRHTSLPLRRGITSYFPEIPHGALARRSILQLSSMRRKYHAAYFCKKCVSADIHFHGVSYWRRDHQIPGQMWCPKHKCALNFVSSGDPFLSSPIQFVAASEAIPDTLVDESSENVHVQRFLDIAAAIYDRAAPFSVTLVAPMLGDLGRSLGFKSNPKNCKGDLISERIIEVFPRQWLDSVFHGLSLKEPGSYSHRIDGVMHQKTSASSVTAYLLVWAVLFDSAEAAINALSNARHLSSVPTEHNSRRVHKLPEDESLIDLYVEAMGAHTEVAKKLNIPIYTVRPALLRLGLPTLSAAIDSTAIRRVASLSAFYLHRLSFAASARASGLSEERFEGLLRMCGPNLPKALKRMSPKNTPKPRARRAKQTLPTQTAAMA